MRKLRLKKLDEGGAAIAAAKGFWFHPSDPVEKSITPSKNFDFAYIGTYPLDRQVYVWNEGIYTCILYSTFSSDSSTNIIVIGGSITANEQIRDPKTIISRLNWAVTNPDYPKTIHESNMKVRYVANNIKLSGNLIKSGILDAWKLDINSKVLSIRSIKDGLEGLLAKS